MFVCFCLLGDLDWLPKHNWSAYHWLQNHRFTGWSTGNKAEVGLHFTIIFKLFESTNFIKSCFFLVLATVLSLFYDILEFFRHVEELIRLPECFLCYTPSPEAGPVCPTPALTNGFITFGSFNNLAKVLVRSYLCLDKCSTCGG